MRGPLFFLLLLCGLAAAAQRPGGGQRPANGRVYGRVLDAATNKGVDFATVSLLPMGRDSVVGGALTAANGDFSIEKVATGRYRVRVAFLGYATLQQEFTLPPDRQELDLGNLLLQPSATVLKAAEVTAERAQSQLQVDRRVYNVEKDLAVRGGTGIDVMKNVPGLTVDADDNVQLRNSSPQIFIDGRPTVLALDQIPADEIERVEVITNPGAAFDAASSGGIINVVLKKSTRPGYNGQVQAGAGTNGRYQGNANINVKDGRWAWNLSGNLNVANNRTRTLLARDSYDAEGVNYFRQSGNTQSDRNHYGGRLGAEHQLTNRSTLSLSGNLRGRSYANDDQLAYTERDAAQLWLRGGDQLNTGENAGNEAGAQVAFKHRTPKEGREWSTDLTWNHSTRRSDQVFGTRATDEAGNALVGGVRTQRNDGSTESDQFTWQFDMTDPRNERTKLEYGLRSNVRDERSVLEVLVGTDTSATAYDPTLSNDYRITDMVNAAYLNVLRKLNDHWGVQAGLRVEQTAFEADIRDPSDPTTRRQRFTYRYPDGLDDIARALFPSLFFSRKWEGTRELQFNFSRKIGRPNFFQVMPFIMFADTRNLRLGNPALAPEFIDLVEANHLLPFKKNPRNTWLTSVFMRHTGNVITSFAYPLADDPRILVNSFINGDESWTYGWENALRLEPFKGAQLTLSGTVQYVEIGAGAVRNNGWMANAKANFNMRLPKDLSVQVNGEYEGRRPQPQGYAIPNGGVDLSASKDFGRHWSTQFTLNDVFFTRLWGNILDTQELYQETERRREMRFLRVNITWKFGEQDASLFRRRDRRDQRRDPGAVGGEGDF